MATHYGPVPVNIDEIADAFGLSEEVLATESIRAFVQNHVDALDAERVKLCSKYGVSTLKEMAGLIQRGRIKEGDAVSDFDRFDYLTDRIQRMKVLLEGMPEPPQVSQPSLGQILESLQTQLPRLAETYGVEVLGIFGPYATGQARAYDKVEVLVDLHKPMGFFQLFDIERELGDAVGGRVQLTAKRGLGATRSEQILSELVDV